MDVPLLDMTSTSEQVLVAVGLKDPQPPAEVEALHKDIFISYSRKNKATAVVIEETLRRDHHIECWVDWNDIPPSIDWLETIYAGIRASDAVVVLISEAALSSEVCGWEWKYAVEQSKKIIPVIVEDSIGMSVVPDYIQKLNWVFCKSCDESTVSTAAENIMNSFNTDVEYSRSQTRLLLRAHIWNDAKCRRDFLLHGEEITVANQWMRESAAKMLPVPPLMLTFIMASSSNRGRLQRRKFFLVIALLILAVLSALVTVFFVFAAEKALKQSRSEQQQLQASEDLMRTFLFQTLCFLDQSGVSIAQCANGTLPETHNMTGSQPTCLQLYNLYWYSFSLSVNKIAPLIPQSLADQAVQQLILASNGTCQLQSSELKFIFGYGPLWDAYVDYWKNHTMG